MSAFLQHLNVTALFESHATVVHSSRSNGTLSDAGEGGYLRDAHRLATFICDCGTRLSIMTDSDKSETTVVPCPREGCEGRHIVRGQVLEVFIVQGGRSVPYDWKHTTG